MSDLKPIKIEITYEDGHKRIWERDDARLWNKAVNGAAHFLQIHGCKFEIPKPKIIPPSKNDIEK